MNEFEWDNPSPKKKDKEDELLQEKLKLIDDIFQTFISQFAPAQSIEDSDIQLTTAEIHRKFIEHYPSELINTEFIFELLTDNGFQSITSGNKLEFFWLLKKRADNVL